MAAPPLFCPSSTTTLPALMENLVEEILLRIPPDEPAHLVRASLVCKAWRRIIFSDSNSDPGFLRRYRTFQGRRPPLLGFFYNDNDRSDNQRQLPPRFMPAETAFPSMPTYFRRHAWSVLDCRHGRVLLENVMDPIVVWDPIGNHWQVLPAHGINSESYSAAVLCAATGGGCDHHDCRRGGPFFVVYLGADATDTTTTIKACVYSSETHAWGTPVSFQLDTECDVDNHRAAAMGDEIYFVVTPGARIILYDLAKHCISSFSSPSICSAPPVVDEAPVLMQNEDGSLGLASTIDGRLYVWSSRMVKNRQGLEWTQERAIELDTVFINKPFVDDVFVTGFAEGFGILYISTEDGTFTYELESGRIREIISRPIDFSAAFPFISFVITPGSPEHASSLTFARCTHITRFKSADV